MGSSPSLSRLSPLRDELNLRLYVSQFLIVVLLNQNLVHFPRVLRRFLHLANGSSLFNGLPKLVILVLQVLYPAINDAHLRFLGANDLSGLLQR